MRRGFATWAAANGWDLKSLMGYVGWKDMKSAMRYIDPTLSFGGLAARPLLDSDAAPWRSSPMRSSAYLALVFDYSFDGLLERLVGWNISLPYISDFSKYIKGSFPSGASAGLSRYRMRVNAPAWLAKGDRLWFQRDGSIMGGQS
ncbi:hypothetical protein ACFSHR_03265 [Azotobacter chroococcum]